MNRRVFLSILLVAFCGCLLWALALQRRSILMLRMELQSKQVRAPALFPVPSELKSTASPEVPRELLRLRNQVSQLRRRRDELQAVRAEKERLVQEITARSTNHVGLPPNYIRKSEARLVGYNSPEETLQSLLYAMRNRDTNSLFNAFTSNSARELQLQVKEQSAVG